jgi:hypothetical protein
MCELLIPNKERPEALKMSLALNLDIGARLSCWISLVTLLLP